MKSKLGLLLSALGSGLLFGAGLIVSGMTLPSKVLGFLDLFGRFDASLAFVMVGAIAVYALADRVRRSRSAPLFAPRFLVPPRRRIDVPLIAGALIFGVGWGLAGYCPGPSLVALAGGGVTTLAFVIAMAVGMFVTGKLTPLWSRQQASSPVVSTNEETAEAM
jgi:hypothetical protein